jgi:pyrroline-5-carboxylate reductase
MKIGFVGYGNMGSALLNGLLEHGALIGHEVIVSNRTIEKLEPLKKAHPLVKIAVHLADVASADIIFLSVRTGEVKELVEQLLPGLRGSAHLITINSGLQIKNLEKEFPGKITKVIPSITMGSGHGVALICHNREVDAGSAFLIEEMFSHVGMVQIVNEDQFEVAADLTSSAPAFITDFVQKFAEAGVRHSDLDPETARRMVMETLLGTALVLSSGEVDFDEFKSKVATKGGVTEQGLAVLDQELPQMLDKVLEATILKHEAVKGLITRQFDV